MDVLEPELGRNLLRSKSEGLAGPPARFAFDPGVVRNLEKSEAFPSFLCAEAAPHVAFFELDTFSSTAVMLALEPPLYIELFDRSAADILTAETAFRGILELMTAAAPAALTLYLLMLLEELYLAFNARASNPSLFVGFNLEEDAFAFVAFNALSFVELNFAFEPFRLNVEAIPNPPPPPPPIGTL